MEKQDALSEFVTRLGPAERSALAVLLRPQPEPVALVGMACRTAGGVKSAEEFWEFLIEGRSAIARGPVGRWDVEALYDPEPSAPGKICTRQGGFMEDAFMFDPAFFGLSPREALRLDPQHRLLLEVAWEALENAGQAADRLAGSSTGVYVGIWDNRYIQMQLTGANGCVNDPHLFIGSSCNAAAGRLSYLLDLQGPCIALDTACSSSLVAVHLACQSLRNHECDLALAGGVNVVPSADFLVNLSKMRMLSPDGQCKTLDASADGFGFSEGCGVVALKRLKDALADNDSVLAVIRGSAINEDGRSRGGMTAPNGAAQQALIRRALAEAGLEPNDIDYVELHGTGTPLGDTIEVSALQAALTRARPAGQPLLIGSVKTNVGHMIAAAGMAGLIKTVLSLQKGMIPPHLNLREPNPRIAWDESLKVPLLPTPWASAAGRPRRAGVNSFGWAGTNAHVIVEEPPARPPRGRARPWQLLPLSAQTDQALEQAGRNLAAYLRKHPDVDLADAAYTLQVGRTRFRQRQVALCRDAAEACALLEDSRPPNVLRGSAGSGYTTPLMVRHRSGPADPVFLFPGVGDQYVNVAAETYRDEAVFREHLDRCCESLLPHLNLDLRTILYRPGPDVQAGADASRGAPGMLSRTPRWTPPPLGASVVQPLLFSLEYALARLWISWGVKPQAMHGYSLGEYVAACLAEVFSLEDALRLVARRAQLLEEFCERGAMLAVCLPADELAARLPEGVDVAAVNGPLMCVAGGPVAELQHLAERLTREGVACQFVQTSHALHTRWMAPAEAPFRELLETVRFLPPQTPYVSNVTGTWVTPEQVTSPDYWVAHLRQPVLFSEGIRTLLQSRAPAFLEVGIGQTVGSLVLQHPSAAARPLVVSSLPAEHDRQPEALYLLRSLGRLWLEGVDVDWTRFHGGERRRRCALPTYPFDRKEYSPAAAVFSSEPAPVPPTPDAREAPQDGEQKDVADWFYLPTWRRSPLLKRDPQTAGEVWLLFADEGGLGAALSTRLRQGGAETVLVSRGESFRRLGENSYSIDPGNKDDYLALVKHLSAVKQFPERIAHLWGVTPPAGAPLGGEGVRETLRDGFYSLLYLAQALGQQLTVRPLHLSVVSSGMQDVLGAEETSPAKATLLGPCMVIPEEYPHVTCNSIDIVWEPGGADEVVRQLADELLFGDRGTSVAYRGASRWTPSLEPTRLGRDQAERGRRRLLRGGVYLITGGFGGLGASIASHLAQALQARLVLVGRKPLPGRDEWDAAVGGGKDPAAERIRQIRRLEASGAEVLAASCDVADEGQVRSLLADVHARFGKIDGVFHAAGVPGEGLIAFKAPEKAEAVLAPKLYGTLALYQCLKDEGLDFLLLYSSVVVATGGFGEVDYCAANAFLDAFANRLRSREGYPVQSINWGLWQWDAWQAPALNALPEMFRRIKEIRQNYGITHEEGVTAVERILGVALPQVMVWPQTPGKTIAQWRALTSPEALNAGRPGSERYPRPPLHTVYVAPRNEGEQKVAELWAECLSLERVGVHDPFMELGGNSLLGIVLVSKLREAFQMNLSASVLYDGPTVSALCELLRPGGHEQAALAEHSQRGERRRGMREEQLRKRRRIATPAEARPGHE